MTEYCILCQGLLLFPAGFKIFNHRMKLTNKMVRIRWTLSGPTGGLLKTLIKTCFFSWIDVLHQLSGQQAKRRENFGCWSFRTAQPCSYDQVIGFQRACHLIDCVICPYFSMLKTLLVRATRFGWLTNISTLQVSARGLYFQQEGCTSALNKPSYNDFEQ